jgi:CubicO group peptidase (beta-lactamase class C family)
MKTLLMVALYALQAPALNAQAPISAFRAIDDTVVARFNRDDFKAIYAMAGSSYKALNTEAELAGTLASFKKTVGPVASSELIEDLGEVEYFKWTGPHGIMKFELWLQGSTVTRFKFDSFIQQPSLSTKPILTDNPLRTPVDSAVHKYATLYMSDPKAVGLSIGIYRNGKKYSYGYGEVEKGSGRTPNQRTIYSLGSVTKTFVGTLLAKAVVEGRLDLRDDIRKYLDGEFPNLAFKGHPIRLVDLANHTWGFNRFRINKFPANYENMTPDEQRLYFDAYTRDSLLRDLHQVTLDTVPGTRYHYNIGGMLLLGMALEKVYGQPLDQLVRDYFGNVFHMRDTKLISDSADMNRYARGYNDKGDLMPQQPELTASLYTMKSTTQDMLEYLEANVQESNEAIRLSHQQTWGDIKSFGVGLTWNMSDYFGKGTWLKHSGFDYGSITLCSVYPSAQFGMILWANDDSRQGTLFDLERNIKDNLDYLASRKQ